MDVAQQSVPGRHGAPPRGSRSARWQPCGRRAVKPVDRALPGSRNRGGVANRSGSLDGRAAMTALFAETALLPDGWAARRPARDRRRGRPRGGRRPARSAGGRGAARGRGPARHAEPAQPRLPARHGRARRAPGAGRGLVLDLARGDVPLPRADRARGAARRSPPSSTSRCWRRATPRSASSTTCTTSPTGGAYADPAELSLGDPRGAARDRHRPHPSAGALHGRRLRRRAAGAGPAPLPARPRRLRPAARAAARARSRATPICGSASRRIRCARCRTRRCARRSACWTGSTRTRRSTSTSPSRRGRSATASPGAASARSRICSRSPRSTRAGAWSTPPTWTTTRRRRWRRAARSPACARPPRPTSATACSTSRPSSPPAAASASAPTATSRSARSRSCAGSSTASALTTLRRLVAASAAEPHCGARLWRAALAGGAQALGRRIGQLAPGYRADLVRLDADHPLLAGRTRRPPARQPGVLRQRQPGARRHGRRPLAGPGRPPPRARAHRRRLSPDHRHADLTVRQPGVALGAEPGSLAGQARE